MGRKSISSRKKSPQRQRVPRISLSHFASFLTVLAAIITAIAAIVAPVAAFIQWLLG